MLHLFHLPGLPVELMSPACLSRVLCCFHVVVVICMLYSEIWVLVFQDYLHYLLNWFSAIITSSLLLFFYAVPVGSLQTQTKQRSRLYICFRDGNMFSCTLPIVIHTYVRMQSSAAPWCSELQIYQQQIVCKLRNCKEKLHTA